MHKGSHALGSKGEVAEAFSQSVYGAVTGFGRGAHSMRLMTHTNTQIQQNVQLDKTKIQLKQNQIQLRLVCVSIDRLGPSTQVITHKNFSCEETSNSQCSFAGMVGLFNWQNPMHHRRGLLGLYCYMVGKCDARTVMLLVDTKPTNVLGLALAIS